MARLSIFNLKAGSRFSGPFALESPVAFLEMRNRHCLCVLVSGRSYIWELRPPNSSVCIHSSLSTPFCRENERIQRCFLTDGPSILLTTNHDRSFVYCQKQQTWLELSESLSRSLSKPSSKQNVELQGVIVSSMNLSTRAQGNADIQRSYIKDALARNVIWARESGGVDDYIAGVMAYFRFLVRDDKATVGSIGFEAEIRDFFGSLLSMTESEQKGKGFSLPVNLIRNFERTLKVIYFIPCRQRKRVNLFEIY